MDYIERQVLGVDLTRGAVDAPSLNKWGLSAFAWSFDMGNWVREFVKDEDGLTTVEYAIAGALVAAAAATAFTTLGSSIATGISSLASVVASS
jgi:pilus assembly protein Flp/PilA